MEEKIRLTENSLSESPILKDELLAVADRHCLDSDILHHSLEFFFLKKKVHIINRDKNVWRCLDFPGFVL